MSDTEPTGGKQDLRDEFLQLRRTLSPAQIETARTDVRAAVVQRCIDARWTTVAGYLPLRTEPGSHELLDELVEHGVRVLVPVMLPDRDLDWVALPGDVPLRPDAIASAQAVLVPALAVAADGTRLGRGGGSYDRALARVPAGIPVAALLYDGEVVAHLPRDPWDRPVNAYVTPSTGWVDI
ncbi:MAG TPA: 5-formyltetrahydrofolate cyclo-ligase [Jatrophihabitans sp.]